MKTGNAIVAKTQYFENYIDTPKKGQVLNDKYFAFAINKEIRTFAPVKATTQWSKDFNKMNDFVGVKKTVRQFEISEEDFAQTVMDYLLFEKKIDPKTFADNITRKVLYSSAITQDRESININIKLPNNE